MTINNYQKKIVGNELVVSADCSLGRKKVCVYFALPKRFSDFVANDMSPFTALAMVPAMKKREKIIVSGSISKKLQTNLQKFMSVFESWKLGLSPVEIKALETATDRFGARNVGVFFSAGVDSFVAYLRSKEQGEKANYLIFIHGFDVDVENQELFDLVNSKIKEIARVEKIEVISVRTNLRKFTDLFVGWEYSHGTALGAIAVLLRQGFRKIIIPGSYSTAELHPWGSHPDLDPLWSTETLQVVNDSGDLNRLEKVQKYIAKSDLALKYLRVCWMNRAYNCCHCEKCLRTMTNLAIAGVLDKAITFNLPLKLNLVRNIYVSGKFGNLFHWEIINELRKYNENPELLAAWEYSLQQSANPRLLRRLRDILHYFDKSFNQDRIYKFMLNAGLIN